MATASNPLASAIEYRIRPAEETDLGFVVESWSREAYQLHKGARLSTFRQRLKEYISRRIAAGDQILVACDSIEPAVGYGWICCSPALVRFAFVKPQFRRAGIGRALVQAAGFTVQVPTSSRLTPIIQAIKHTHPDQLVYIPFAE